MVRLAAHITAILTLSLASPAMSVAQPRGCAILDDPAQRAQCVAREQARSVARAEVQRQLAARGSSQLGERRTRPSAQWTRAIDEARGMDASLLVQPRPIAAVIGLTWLVLGARRRWAALRRVRA